MKVDTESVQGVKNGVDVSILLHPHHNPGSAALEILDP